MMDEKIVCFPTKLLVGRDCKKNNNLRVGGDFSRGLVFFDRELLGDIFDNLVLLPRSQAEKDFGHKQLVVYIAIKSGDKFLSYKRTKKTTEERLREMYSLGIGGHVNLEDQVNLCLFSYEDDPYPAFLTSAVWRELKEEINIKSPLMGEPRLRAFINDDSTDVGKVHFGFLWLLEIQGEEVLRRGEKGIGDLKFLSPEDIEAAYPQMETWSQLLWDFVKKEKIGIPPTPTAV